MNIQINTSHNIRGNQTLIAKFTSSIESALYRMSDNITRVEVHLSDENGDKSGKNDKRCLIEAHLEGRQPIVVTNYASDLNQSFYGAADKLVDLIESILGRRRAQRNKKNNRFAHEQKFRE